MRVEILVPERLSEITLEQYQRFTALDQSADPDFLMRKMLDIFCGVKDILKVKKKDVDRVASHLTELLSQKAPLVTRFNLDGKEYGFIPNLEEITFGEFVDLDNLLKWDTMHRAMAVLFRPVLNKSGEMYTIEDYDTSTKYDLRKMPLDAALGALVFFWTIAKELSLDSLLYLMSEKKEVSASTVREVSTLLSTDGLRPSTGYQEAMLPNKGKLPDYQLANAFIRSHSLLKETR